MKRTNRHKNILTWIAVCAVGLGWNALGQTSDPALNALVKKGILTEAEAKQALADAQAEKKTEPGVTQTNRNPFVFSVGQELKLKLGGFIQGNAEFGDVGSPDGNFADNPTDARGRTPLHDPRFRLRRARINVSGEFLERFDFKAEGDFQQGDGIGSDRTGFSATDIFINYNRIPEANLRFGQYKAPFGLEQLTSDTILYIAERSLPTSALTPERQVGVQVWGKPLARLNPDHKDLFEYAIGAFNGNGRNINVNDDGHLMYVARGVFTPFTGKLLDQPVKWKIGANGMYSRYGEGTRISPGGGLALNADGALRGFSAPDTAQAWGWGVDQWLTVGPFDLMAEYLEQKISPKYSDFDGFVANGYYIQPSYFFPGRKFQLVARWESFNPGQAPDDDIKSVVGGLNWYIKGDNIKMMFNYYHTWSDFRNENPRFGKDEFDMGLVRVQLMF